MKKTKKELLKEVETAKKLNDKLIAINKKISTIEAEREKIYSELRKEMMKICKCNPKGIFKEKSIDNL